MRPRVFPAEDYRRAHRAACITGGRFNEAAGIPRGRLDNWWVRKAYNWLLQ